jgi:hypothetical protein
VHERIRIAGACDRSTLSEVVQAGAWIVCDCVGCEGELLDPDEVPVLASCSLLVEAHDLLVAGITEIPTEPRYVNDFPHLDFMPLVTHQLAISEFRGAPMAWLLLRPLEEV